MGLFEKKKVGYYDTEYFRNKVKIDELKEREKLQAQKKEIATLKQKVNKGSGFIGFMESMYGGGGLLHGMYGPKRPAPVQHRKKHRARVRTKIVYVQAPPRW